MNKKSTVIDMAGATYGNWLVRERAANSKHRHAKWIAMCLICQSESTVYGDALRRGISKKCTTCAAYVHGHCKSIESRTPTYRTWMTMKQRCNNENADNYPYYGGRGISICDRWNSFKNFLEDMGERPIGTSIDRIDVNGNYEPGNCRWASPKQQRQNQRKAA